MKQEFSFQYNKVQNSPVNNPIKKEEKPVYYKPSIEVIEMEPEGILCASAPSLPGEDW